MEADGGQVASGAPPLSAKAAGRGGRGAAVPSPTEANGLAQAQARGVDVGSTVATLPTVDELVAMGRAVLGF